MSNSPSDSDVLRNLLNEKMIIATEGNSVTLIEEKAKDSQITITDLPDDIIVIRLDEFSCKRNPTQEEIDEIKRTEDKNKKNEMSARAKCAFIGNSHENACADYVLLSPSLRIVLFLELKSTKAGKEHVINQLKGAKCFFECCKLYVSQFFKNVQSDFLRNYRLRFFGCLKTDSKWWALDSKRQPRPTDTKPEKGSIPNTPEKHEAIEGRTVSFNKLSWIECDV